MVSPFPGGNPDSHAASNRGTDIMFAFLRRKSRSATYQWKPAVDLTDPRVHAILKTFWS